MTYEPIWSGIIACYLFLGGLGGGAFTSAALLHGLCPGTDKMRRAGHFIAPVVVMVGLVLLMADARAGFTHPLRFALLLTNFGSVMTWGVVILGAFVVAALAAAVLEFLHREVPRLLEIAGSLLGVCTAIYTGCLLGVCETFPLWNNALLPILFAVSGVSTGMSAVLLAGQLRAPGELESAAVFQRIHFAFPCVEILLIASLLFITASGDAAGAASVQALVCGKYALVFWVVFALVGLAGPVAIDAVLLFVRPELEHRPAGRAAGIGANVGVLIGGFVLRLLVLISAVPVTLAAAWVL